MLLRAAFVSFRSAIAEEPFAGGRFGRAGGAASLMRCHVGESSFEELDQLCKWPFFSVSTKRRAVTLAGGPANPAEGFQREGLSIQGVSP